MQLDNDTQNALQRFKDDPTDTHAQQQIGNGFWRALIDAVGNVIHNGEDLDGFLDKEYATINFGIDSQLVQSDTIDKIQDTDYRYPHLSVSVLTEWIHHSVNELLGKYDEKQLQNEYKRLQKELIAKKREMAQYQNKRQRILKENLPESVVNQWDGFVKEQVKNDSHGHMIARQKRDISLGKAVSGSDRRELVQTENEFNTQREQLETLIGQVNDETRRHELKNCVNSIDRQIQHQLDYEDKLNECRERIQKVRNKSSGISALETENYIREELTYLRDLIMLSAKRMRIPAMSLLKPEDTFFSFSTLHACFDRVYEFDPKIFVNSRAAYMGKPTVLLIPGSGKAIYDWKHNCILVPMVVPGGNYMMSVASGMVEYRLDVDEDKQLMESYAKLPHVKDVKSISQRKEALIKDYITWMTQEYKGYKVLSRETRQWFEHEIAPSKWDVYTSVHFLPQEFNARQFNDRLSSLKKEMDQEGDATDGTTLWEAGVLLFLQGEYEQAYTVFSRYCAKGDPNGWGAYNLAQSAMKSNRKSDAATAFQTFMEQHSQSWYAGVAREHLKRLRM